LQVNGTAPVPREGLRRSINLYVWSYCATCCLTVSDPAGVGEVHAVRQVGVLGEETEAVAEHAGILELGVELICQHVALFFDYVELLGVGEVLFVAFLLVDYEFETEVAAETVGINNRTHSVVSAGNGVGYIGGLYIEYLDAVPCGSHFLFPCHDFLGLGIVVGGEFAGTGSLLGVEA